MKIVALFDKVAERYGKPFTTENLAIAERDFATACKDEKTPMFMYPNDMELHYLGEYDELTGKITQTQVITIAEAKNYFTKEELKKKISINRTNPQTNKEFKQKIKEERENLRNG